MEGLVITPDSKASRKKNTDGAGPRVLVTGADGYIGSILCPLLSEAGFEVTGLDTGFYRGAWLYNDGRERPRVVTRDIRRLRSKDLKGFDAVVHLAELSNDPLCAFDEDLTVGINHVGTLAVAEAARAAGVPRFVYASSCSVYGVGRNEILDEKSTPNPQTAYARCKVAVEHDLSAMADKSFCPTFLRFATAFGASPRMRFDIVVNNLSGMAWTTRRITMTSDGTPWRPLCHVQDIAGAIHATLDAPREAVFNEILNVGDDRNNYQVRDVSETVADVFSTLDIEYGSNGGDNRSYHVSFAKIRKHLPDFECRWNVERGAQQLRTVFERTGMTKEVFEAPPYTRLSALQQLCDTRQVDERLFWRNDDLS